MIKSIIRKEIQVTLKEKGTFFWLFLLPIFFIVIFASIFGNTTDKITVSYYDQDHSQMSKVFLKQLNQIPGFELKKDSTKSLNEQIKEIKDGKSTSLLVIPKGYEENLMANKPADIQLYRDATADSAVAPIKAVLENMASSFREAKLSKTLQTLGQNADQAKETLTPPVKLKEVKENATKLNMITQVVPGYTVMFVFFIMITMVRNFIKDKESGMLSRLRSTPMKSYHYLIGMWVPNILVVLTQSTVLLVFGKVVYDLNIGDVLSIILIVISLAVCATGLGLLLSVFVRSENQGVAFVQIITMGGAIAGGLWFPYDFLPRFAQIVGKFTPQYWAQQGMQNVMIRGAHLEDIWVPVLILLGFGLIGLVIASLRFKKFFTSAIN
ncbi:multidrug ABC transporter permease [Bacillus sp. MUM 116]|uniref:ABC transporter permease n=1 Tax=Bacillus sp. MUM 116 TaxID=1678002 RepID=UPI0008F5C50C|nr:ABC transporter permease [Bacillus sp. MUM 116]OIK15614.1 multidrug ABC transporter permease [Bacillus sp. MUM 116]